MAKSQQSFNKAEKEKKKAQKKKEKLKRKEERLSQKSESGKSLDDMIAYVDEYGNITDTPPDPANKKEFKAEDSMIAVPKKTKEEFDPVHKGIVDFFNDSKGFGFIKELDSRDSYFFHVNGCIDEVVEGNKVSFELEKGMKGMNAVKVTKI